MMATLSLVPPLMVDAGETRMAPGNYRAPNQRLMGEDHNMLCLAENRLMMVEHQLVDL